MDAFGNYLYCVDCLVTYLQIGQHRLRHQREIKQKQLTEPVVLLSKRDVITRRLEKYVLPPVDESM